MVKRRLEKGRRYSTLCEISGPLEYLGNRQSLTWLASAITSAKREPASLLAV